MNHGKLLVCLTPECGMIASSRGICNKCRARIRRAVKAGQTTLAAEEAAGRMLTSKKTLWGMKAPEAY